MLNIQHAWLVALTLLLSEGQLFTRETADAESFDRDIAPILASYCLDCHSGPEPKGGLNLSSRASALQGGDSGTAIEPGRLDTSLLWQRIANGDMPPKEKLPKQARATLRAWIAGGAVWGADSIDPFRFTTSKRAGVDWWSLRPLAHVDVPQMEDSDRVRNTVDAFVLDKLQENALEFSPDADARTLIRRLYFDLVGLPPAATEVERFVADPSEPAYLALVDRLLASPEYGERWARHWLDVARFGESDGFERNHPRKTIWRYRDWVINAFNRDMPYDEFTRMQIAGDVLSEGTPEGLAAVGFLVAGVHNTVVGQSERMKRQSRQDEVEELVGAIGQTFVGLTINCGRCHDHKFDPIRQEEYYQLASAIAGVRHGEKETREPRDEKRLHEVQGQFAKTAKRIVEIERQPREVILRARKSETTSADTPASAPAGPITKPFAIWEFDDDFNDSVGKLHGTTVGGAYLDGRGALVLDGSGYVETARLQQTVTEKTLEAWVILDDLDQRGGSVITMQRTDGHIFDAIVFGENEPRKWMSGSDQHRRTKPFAGEEEREAASRPVHLAIVYSANKMITAYRDGAPYGTPYEASTLRDHPANRTQILFGLRHTPAGPERLLKGRILRAQLHLRALSAAEVAVSAAADVKFVSTEELLGAINESDRKVHEKLIARRQALIAEKVELENRKFKTYTVKPSQPDETYLLLRGDVMERGRKIAPGAVAAASLSGSNFGLALDASDSERRKKLARWITNSARPLFTRVIVNRLWHYHFGSGIVETPNDLGFNGGRPSHSKLLDWLADRLIDGGYRLKSIHRIIVTSTTYRQAARFDERAHAVDASNRLLWRKSPRRLEAEVLRDSLLSLSGQLNPTRGGPSFENVDIVPNNGTTYYTPFDREDPALNRRTVYQFWPRGGRSALLDTFDCPDPSSTAPRRTITTTPLQALSLLNNAFVLRMTDHFAERVSSEVGEQIEAQVEHAYALAYHRPPDAEERQLAIELVIAHGLPSLARALFNSNEFVVIE